MALPSPTEQQIRIAADLARHAADKAKVVMERSTSLIEHPIQRYLIGIQVAAAAIAHASVALKMSAPHLRNEELMTQTCDLLRDVLAGGAPLSGSPFDPKETTKP